MIMGKRASTLLAAAVWAVGCACGVTAREAEGEPYLKEYLAKLNAAYGTANETEAKAQIGRAIANAVQIQQDIEKAGGVWRGKPLAVYIVPPISPIKRLPHVIPPDGELGDRLKIIAARGEFEPASFQVFPFDDIAALELRKSPLVGDAGEIPADAIDIKVVKCWYQAGTAWHSYFADPTRRELVPELLLHDDSLIKVDYATRDNYLRVDYPQGSEYVWVSYTKRNDPGLFNYATEPVADSSTLKPVKLSAGEGKQFWITVKPPESAAPGNYQTVITLVADGQVVGNIALRLRVLPFSLPDPKTYYDLGKDFYVSIYNDCSIVKHMRLNGGDIEQASRKLLAEYRDMRDHGCNYPLLPRWDRKNPDQNKSREAFIRQLEILKQSGLKTKPVFGAVNPTEYWVIFRTPAERGKDVLPRYKQRADEEFAAVKQVLGHNDVYAVGWDEPSTRMLVGQRETWRYIHEKGGRIISTGKDKHLIYAGFNEDFSNYGGRYDAASARKWHAIGARITTYATPHTGPENPDFIRRTHGMALYKADLDGTCNYKYYEGPPNIWNEFNRSRYRCFCMVYPTKDDVIDTIAWEGFREAIDDVRYATKLRQLAFKAIASGDVDNRYAGKTALQWLALLDEKSADLNTMRLEMINHIMTIHGALNGDDR